MFDLCLVVADGGHPLDLARLEKVVERIDRTLSGSDCTVGVLVVGVDGLIAVNLAGHRKLAWTRPLVPAPGDPAPFVRTRGDQTRKEDNSDVRLAS